MRTRRIGQWAAVGITAVATSVAAGFFAPGADNGWDISGASSAMTETFLGSGIWEYNAVPGTPNARTTWNIVAIAGDWGSQLFGSDQWGTYDGGGNVKLTLDTNTYNDEWLPATNRIYTDTLALDAWAASGNWVAAAGLGIDWDLGTAPAMTNNAGIFELVIAGGALAPGIYDWKPIANGSWDSTGDGTGVNVNAGNSQFTVVGNEPITLRMDSANGTTQAVPAPGAFALLGLGGIAATRRRRR